MKLPWQDKTGLAKTTTILGCLLLLSIGLCGANAAVFNAASISVSGGGTDSGFSQILGTLLIMLGAIELITILASIAGLLIVLILWLGLKIKSAFSR